MGMKMVKMRSMVMKMSKMVKKKLDTNYVSHS